MESELPNQGITRRVSYSLFDEMRVHYLSWEAEECSQPAILLHGLASNARIWDKVAPRLAGSGWRVLAPDLRGHGQTDKPDEGYDFGSLTKDLAAAVEGWNAYYPLLVGHSWGASLAIAYAARFPAGPLSPSGLVLVDGGVARLADEPGASWESLREQLKPPPLAGMTVDEFLGRVRNGQAGWQPDDLDLQIILANFSVSEEETITPHLSLVHHLAILHGLWQMDTWEQLGRVRCPVLAILAQPRKLEGDAWYQRKLHGATTAQKIIPQLEVLWLEDSIHDIPLQRPVELAGAIQAFSSRIA